MKLNPLFSFLMLQIVMLTVCFELDLNQFHFLCTDAICQFFGCCLYNVEYLENEINRVQMLQVKSRPSMFKSSCRLPYEKQISKKERKLAHSICKWFCLSRFISSVDDLALKSIICMQFLWGGYIYGLAKVLVKLRQHSLLEAYIMHGMITSDTHWSVQ